MKRKRWIRYISMGIAFLLALLMLAGLIIPYL
jgi:hypothetical protein